MVCNLIDMVVMISIIVCSVNPTLVSEFCRNVSQTIGVESEVLIFDNREYGAGITHVYNVCAERAKYDLLCFAHEDIIFNTNGWGQIIAEQLQRPDCGVIGFAGATVKSRNYSGWGQREMHNRMNYTQHFKDKPTLRYANIDPALEFDRVVTLDGLALFVRKDVWSENRFDEELIKGFHCYDLDFTLQVNLNYNNYICNCVDVEHLSAGNYNDAWFMDTIRLHDEKWGDILPVSVHELSPRKSRRNERVVDYAFVNRMVLRGSSRERCRRMVLSHARKYWLANGSLSLIVRHFLNAVRR